MTETTPKLIAYEVPKKGDVWFEHVGEYYDDVLVSFEYDEPAVAAISALLSWDGWWDADFQVWRVNPGYADRLAATLRDLGYTVRCSRKAANLADELIERERSWR